MHAGTHRSAQLRRHPLLFLELEVCVFEERVSDQRHHLPLLPELADRPAQPEERADQEGESSDHDQQNLPALEHYLIDCLEEDDCGPRTGEVVGRDLYLLCVEGVLSGSVAVLVDALDVPSEQVGDVQRFDVVSVELHYRVVLQDPRSLQSALRRVLQRIPRKGIVLLHRLSFIHWRGHIEEPVSFLPAQQLGFVLYC